MNGKHSRIDGGGNVHWSAVHADHKGCGANQPDHLSNCRSIEEVDCIARQLVLHLPDAGQDDSHWTHGVAEFDDVRLGKGLSFTSGKRMKEDERTVLKGHIEWCSGGKWKRGVRDFWQTKRLKDSQIPVHGMFSSAHRRDIIIKPPCAFTRVSHSHASPRAAETRHERASKQALQIQRDVGTNLFESKRPRNGPEHSGNTAKFFARKRDGTINRGIVCEERFPPFIHEPRDSRIGKELLQRGRAGNRVNNITERARFDQKERLQLRQTRAWKYRGFLTPHRETLSEFSGQAGFDDGLLGGG